MPDALYFLLIDYHIYLLSPLSQKTKKSECEKLFLFFTFLLTGDRISLACSCSKTFKYPSERAILREEMKSVVNIRRDFCMEFNTPGMFTSVFMNAVNESKHCEPLANTQNLCIYKF